MTARTLTWLRAANDKTKARLWTLYIDISRLVLGPSTTRSTQPAETSARLVNAHIIMIFQVVRIIRAKLQREPRLSPTHNQLQILMQAKDSQMNKDAIHTPNPIIAIAQQLANFKR